MRTIHFAAVVLLYFSSLLANDEYHQNPLPSKMENPIPLADLEGEPSAIVNGVNVITGDFIECQCDITLPGIKPLALERSCYSTDPRLGNLSLTWNFNFGSTLILDEIVINKHSDLRAVLLEGSSSTSFSYFTKTKHAPKTFEMSVSREMIEKGVTNTSIGLMSGRTNIKNTKVIRTEKKMPRVRTSFGVEQYFGKVTETDGYGTHAQYQITKEVEPTGDFILYDYQKKDHLASVRRNTKTGKIIASFTFKEIKEKNSKRIEVTTNDNRRLIYHLSKKGQLEKVERTDAPCVTYQYELKKHRVPKINRRELPHHRFLEIHYYDEKEEQNADRVKTLSAPIGQDKTPHTTHRFCYEEGQTDVYDALNHKTRYKYNQDQRLIEIRKYDDKKHVYCCEKLFWGANDSKESTNLKMRTFENARKSIQFIRAYQYDDNNNIVCDRLYGNLSGSNSQGPQTDGQGNPLSNSCECEEKCYTYTDDGLNLVSQETHHRQTISYIYETGTDRLLGKLTSSDNRICQREFYEYNEDGALIKETIDDGIQADKNSLEGITERHIKLYKPLKVFPFGLPKVIEERCLDIANQTEKLVHKTKNYYSPHGQLEKQNHYDSNGQLVYALTWKYDAHGNVCEETDAMGRTIIRTYDDNDNLKSEKGPRQDFSKTFEYDWMNRLIKEEEKHSDGIVLTTHYRYDYLGNCIATIDPYGNETTYRYDAFGRVIETICPPVLNEEGQLYQPKVQTQYDEMNHVTSVIDSRGCKTQTTFNIRGQPVDVFYPDGTTEKTLYNLDGTPKQTHAKNGTVTHFTYDHAQRPVKQEIHSPSGEPLIETSKTYGSFHLLTETDPAGHLTTYTYYPDGKPHQITKGNLTITYEYDSLGRPHRIRETYGSQPEDIIVKIQEHDLLGRITQERIEDFKQTPQTLIQHEYDTYGSWKKVINYHQNRASETITFYNSRQEPWKIIDAEGNETLTHYRYDYRNIHGQCVPYKEIIDPMGNRTEVISDALGREVSLVRKNSLGQTLQKKEIAYDPSGNRVRLTETNFACGQETQIVTRWAYDAANHLIDSWEAYGTPEQKHTTLSYKDGQKAQTMKPDGTKLLYTYDALGRLSTFKASDESIHYAYEYDSNGNAIKVSDLKNNTVTTRTYNDNNQLLQETLGNGLTMTYTYDYLGRPMTITYPDHTTASYTYDASQLKKIQRNDYCHEYQAYDLSGHLLQAQLIGQIGTISYEYDPLGRPLKTDAPQWSETIHEYDKAGNLLSKEVQEEETIRSTFTYDDLYQLVSETGVASHHYTSDSLYNHIEKDNEILTYNALNQPQNPNYLYDANGNLIKKDAETYTYDALDRLIGYAKDDMRVQYTYDENNRRLRKKTFNKDNENSDIRYIYQGTNEVGSCDLQDHILELRLLGIGRGAEIGAAIAIELDGKTYAPIHDSQGNVTCLLDQEGKIFEKYRYTAFGEEPFEEAKNPWRYSSKRLDEESQLIYFGQRYYDSVTARWLTPDPLGDVGGSNLYAYVLNNPLTHVDLYGLFESPGEIGLHHTYYPRVGRAGYKPTHRIGDNLVRLVGRTLKAVGHNMIPIPFVKDVVEFAGWCASFKHPMDYVPDWKRPHSRVFEHKGKNGPIAKNAVVMLYTGLGAPEDDVKERTRKVSESLGDIDVITVYKGDRGFALNAMEYILQRLGVAIRSTKVAQEAAELATKRVGENGVIFTIAHSQGGLVLHQTPPETKRMMIAYTLGSAKIAQSEEYKRAANYIGPYDIVPCIDPIGTIKGLRNGNVHYVKSIGNPFYNHFWDRGTYQETLKDIYFEIRKITTGDK